MEREALYDQVLELYEGHIQAKKKKSDEKEKAAQLEKELSTAGAASRNAAMGNMATYMHFDEDETDSSDLTDSAQQRARKRREERRKKMQSEKQKFFRTLLSHFVK